MTRTAPTLALLALALAATAVAPAARAETTACTQIKSLPTTLTSQGIYCLNRDFAVKFETGAAITVATNNVTIDCNGYKLGNLQATDSTSAAGVLANNRLNVTVRGCGIRGFRMGVSLVGGGHLVEDNRFDFNRHVGVMVDGDGSLVRRNRILATGGGTYPMGSTGIYALHGVDVIDNLVSGVEAVPGTTNYAFGVFAIYNYGGSIQRNRVRGLAGGGTDQAVGIDVNTSDAMSLRDNTVVASTGGGTGLKCGGADSMADGNHVLGFTAPVVACTSGTKNNVL